MRNFDKLEELAYKGNAPKIYEKIGNSLKPQCWINYFRTQRGDLATDSQSLLNLCRYHLEMVSHFICRWQWKKCFIARKQRNSIKPVKYGNVKALPNPWKGGYHSLINYGRIDLLNSASQDISSVLYERLQPTVKNLIGPYQCGIRPSKSTIDQILSMRQSLKKTHDKSVDTPTLRRFYCRFPVE